jgi:hypothetical protein
MTIYFAIVHEDKGSAVVRIANSSRVRDLKRAPR